MKADAKPTLEEAATMVCKGAAPPEWVVERLRQWAGLSYRIEDTDDRTIEQQLFKSALYLQRLLPMYARAADMIGEEYPPCIDEVIKRLDEELIPFLAKEVALPKRRGGPTRSHWRSPRTHSESGRGSAWSNAGQSRDQQRCNELQGHRSYWSKEPHLSEVGK